ncbi:hypothetical protein PFISCL1PPCAC_26794 [Pristionchus fissidentatus]|uniref:Receptor protein-tyrosine kinase n=1 Tax=Pristionchus fissidentatus TaxID=1538716 RepID=A0AAV5WU13_9BILA|nr:hypothetical protein PFISCL1PPCAC_26794 [Pristionchus fissidentatus]
MMIKTEQSRGGRGTMTHLLFPLFLILSLIGDTTAFDVTSNATIHQDEHGRNFILIDEGENIELTCENFQGNHMWELPDNSEVRGFTKEDQATRLKTFVGHDEAEQKLTISNAKVTDTGLYGCKYEDNVEEAVYVFVRGPHFFLKTSIHGFQVDDKFTIPCRSTWPPLEEEGAVELYAEHELWKEASKHYDPRVGFEITAKLMQQKLNNGIGFVCKYKSDSLSFFVQPKSVMNESDYQLSFEEGTEFPYVGGSLEYSCVVEGKNVWEDRFVHRVYTECPRCREKTEMHFKSIHNTLDELRNKTTVDNLTTQDTGAYTCQWFMEKDEKFVLMKEITKQITVSTTMEQIKLLNRTQKFIEIEEGQALNVFAVFRAFPEEKSIYTSKWKRFFVRPHKGVNETEVLINDDSRSVETTHEGRDTIEKLTILKATTDLSGTYLLEVAVNNVTRRVEWMVRVKGKAMTARIEVASPDKWILFDQNYYKVGSALRVICIVESYPKAEVHLMTRKLDPIGDWEDVTGASPIEGTYAKGYNLNVTANDDVEYKCEGRLTGKRTASESRQVRVTDSQTEVNVAWHKPEGAAQSEEKDQIYEGDKIELECIVPKTDQVTMEWLFNMGKAGLPETTTVAAHSKHLIASIETASSTHSGDYTCVVRDEHGAAMNFNRTLEIMKTTKPFLREATVDPNVVVKYGEATDLKCTMDGTPEPQYKWLKDGVEVTEAISKNGQLLHIPRAATQDEGTYICRGSNRAGATDLSYSFKVKGAPKTLSGISILLIVLAFIILLGCLVAAFVLYTRQRKTSKEQARSLQVLYEQLMRGSDSDAPPLPMHGKVTMDQRVRRTAYDSKYEIEMKNLVLLEALGAGQFGSVRKGRLARGAPVSDAVAYRGPSLTVAVKSPRNGSNPADQKALIDELKILIAIDNLEEKKHPNVLSLVGAVTKNMKDGQLFVVFEMCENGDLKTFLQRYKTDLKDKFVNEIRENKQPTASNDDYLIPNNQVTVKYASQGDPDWQADQERDRLIADPKMLSTSDLISFSMQIASGMDFLSGVSCIHRDLAARNCLLTTNRVVKIADFGMAKNEDKGYYRMNKTNVMVPYRWMAPESMEDHTFTVESDVWSYGIVLYEIFTLGSQPYPGVPNNNLHEHLKSGQRNPRPDLCHPDIYDLMLRTWDADFVRRPSFGECRHFMRGQLELANPQLLESADSEIDRNAAQIAQFDQFRGPRATAVLDEHELAALFAGQSTPTSNGAHDEEETGERIYIKELRR